MPRKKKSEMNYNDKLRSAKNRLWKKTSLYVRMKNADHRGVVRCVTCGKMYQWTDMDAGHFIEAGSCSALRFDLKNVHPQCTVCNRYQHGNHKAYTLYMIDTYGRGFVDELLAKKGSMEIKKFNLTDFENMEAEIDERLADIGAEL